MVRIVLTCIGAETRTDDADPYRLQTPCKQQAFFRVKKGLCVDGVDGEYIDRKPACSSNHRKYYHQKERRRTWRRMETG